MSMKVAKCPYCNKKLEIRGLYDTEYFDDKYLEHVNGCCPKCGRGFSWTEHFFYDGFSNLIESSLEEE